MQRAIYISWKITSRSAQEAQVLQQWLSSRIDLDRVMTDTVHATPNGVEQVQTVPHRLGDYFAAIRVVPDNSANTASLRLIFQRRPDAGRFWKDLMVNILQEIEGSAPTATIELDAKAESEPTQRSSVA